MSGAPSCLSVTQPSYRLKQTFTISRGSRTAAQVVEISIARNGHVGQGECYPYARYDETADSVIAQIESIRDGLDQGMDRDALQLALPAGAARNAVDCALWDLEAKTQGVPAWKLAGLDELAPVLTAYTLSLESPEAMQKTAAAHQDKPLLKIKLGGNSDEDIERLRAVRAGALGSRLIVDANEGWSAADYDALAPVLVSLGVEMVEQPLPAGDDGALANRDRPLPVCADEACHDSATLAALAGKYDMINIKLDKTGGLTEALKLKAAADAAGYQVMVGCMVASSLAMAPAMLVAQGVAVVDLDGPLLLAEDKQPAIEYNGAIMQAPSSTLWG